MNVVLTDLQRAGILSAVEKATTPETAFQVAWEGYVEARAETLSGPLKTEVLKYRKNMNRINFSNSGSFTANMVAIELPYELKNSGTALLVMSHELEHVVQLFSSTGIDASKLRLTRTCLAMAFSPRRYWQAETGAMRAEWEMANAIPDTMIDEALLLSKSIKDPEIQKRISFMLMNRKLPLQDYLNANYSTGRYSFGAINTVIADRLVLGAVGAAVVVPSVALLSFMLFNIAEKAGNGAVEAICRRLSADNPLRSGHCASNSASTASPQ